MTNQTHHQSETARALALPPSLRAHARDRVPRYTSYPTAPCFTPVVDDTHMRAWLGTIESGATTSIYLHIPFCRALCWYCGCHTKILTDEVVVARYVETLIAEIDLVASLVPSRLRVTHLHWGGGTPTIVGPAALDRVLAAIRRNFHVESVAELAIEIDPRTLTADMASALGASGFTRASLGVQTFDPVVQQAIHRIQSAEITEAAAQRLRCAGIGSLNVDLIYGLPHQTVGSCIATAERILAINPDRVATFGYAHVPSLKPHQHHLDQALPDADARLDQAEAIAETLVAAGYRRIGFDHFAKPDDKMAHALDATTLGRNFQGYTTDQADALLGFGASAIGRLPQGYVQNTPRIGAYQDAIARGRFSIYRELVLTREDRLRASVIERLMCDLAVDLDAVIEMHHFTDFDFTLERAALAALAADGIVRLAGSRIIVPDAMRPFVRVVAAVFDASRAATATHAPAV